MGEYDPVKAHQYYLRTRQLKGRKTGSNNPTPTTVSKVATGRSGSVTVTNKMRVEPKQDVNTITEKRVAALKVRLEQLKEELERLVKEAKARSGVKSEPNKEPKETTSASSKPAKPKTASQKEEAARKAREYYDETHPEQALERQIKEVKEKIWKARQKLKDAVDSARTKAQP